MADNIQIINHHQSKHHQLNEVPYGGMNRHLVSEKRVGAPREMPWDRGPPCQWTRRGP